MQIDPDHVRKLERAFDTGIEGNDGACIHGWKQ